MLIVDELNHRLLYLKPNGELVIFRPQDDPVRFALKCAQGPPTALTLLRMPIAPR